MKLTLYKPDTLGAFSSGLCLIHCLATPFLFIAHTCSVTCCEAAPIWWKWIDYFFLIISFFAVYRSTQTTSKSSIKPALWISWILLLIAIVNEGFHFFHFPESIKYIAGFSLIGFHLYNLKYCQCKTDEYYINKGGRVNRNDG